VKNQQNYFSIKLSFPLPLLPPILSKKKKERKEIKRKYIYDKTINKVKV